MPKTGNTSGHSTYVHCMFEALRWHDELESCELSPVGKHVFNLEVGNYNHFVCVAHKMVIIANFQVEVCVYVISQEEGNYCVSG